MKWWRRRKPNRIRTDEAPRSYRRPLRLAAAVLALCAAIAAGREYYKRTDWSFTALEITGELERVHAEEVKAVLAPYLEQGFVWIDIRGAREALNEQAWIADAAVRRQWPGTLVVELREEQPAATWFGTSLMNASGTVFLDGAPGFTGVLPDIGGPAGSQADMLSRLAEINAAIAKDELQVRRLLRSERRAERFWLANGIEVRLGRRDIDQRLHRFVHAAWPVLKADADRVAYVDMRYTNGFSVGWKAGTDTARTSGARANVQKNG